MECQLGLGDRRPRLTPTLVESLDTVNAIDVTASLSFSAILTGPVTFRGRVRAQVRLRLRSRVRVRVMAWVRG